MASIFDRQETLRTRTAELSQLLMDLASKGAQVEGVHQDLEALSAAWEHFCEETTQQIEAKRSDNSKKIRAEQLRFMKERARQKERRRHLQLREMSLDVQEQELQKSLERFVQLYQENLTEIELAVQEAKQSRVLKEAERQRQMLRVEKEIQEVLDGVHKPMPTLVLEGLGDPSRGSSVRMSIGSQGDLVTNRSAFSHLTEPEDMSNRLVVPKPPLQAPPKVKFQHRFKEGESPRDKPNVSHSFNSDSQCFGSLVDQLKEHDFSCDDQKWESDSEHGTANSVELSHVLQKAVEFNFYDPEVISQVKEARKLKDIPDAYNARMKSIVKFLKQKKHEKPSLVSARKPPTPTSRWKKRLQIQGPGEVNPDMASTTPKSEFFFPEEVELSRTVQSSNNPLSSRRQAKEQDSIDSYVSDITIADEAKHDVSDLMSIKGLEDQLGLKTISREMSPRSDNSAEVSVIRCLQTLEFSANCGDPVVSNSHLDDSELLDQEAPSMNLQDFEISKVNHRKTGSSDYSGVLNTDSTHSDLNSRFCSCTLV